jgi:heterodisulfide reductase subunit C
MSHSATSRIQEHIGDPVSESPPVEREKLEEIFQDIQADLRYDHELNGCLNCGICTATCPAAHYYDFSPREIVQLSTTQCRRRSGPARSATPAPRAAHSVTRRVDSSC